MTRRAFVWTEHQKAKLDNVLTVFDEYNKYKPLTLRQIYYQLVNKVFENTKSQYNMLSTMLKWARLDGYILWDDVEDRVRSFVDYRGWNDCRGFIKHEKDIFLTGYRRNLMQTQDVYLEVWIEKDALASIFSRICSPYSIPVVICRGFSSVSFLNDFAERVRQVQQQGKKPIMLYFGDFDPSGNEMMKAMETTINDEFRVHGVEFKRVALSKEDIYQYKLPHNPDAIKKNDSRANKHIEEHGMLAVELDALSPAVLEQKITEAIQQEIDIGLFNEQVAIHNDEVKKIKSLKKSIASTSAWRGSTN